MHRGHTKKEIKNAFVQEFNDLLLAKELTQAQLPSVTSEVTKRGREGG